MTDSELLPFIAKKIGISIYCHNDRWYANPYFCGVCWNPFGDWNLFGSGLNKMVKAQYSVEVLDRVWREISPIRFDHDLEYVAWHHDVELVPRAFWEAWYRLEHEDKL